MIATALALLALASPARLQVSADEFSYTLSRPSLVAGPAIVELVNYGEDAHDLRFRRVGGTRTYVVGKTRPGGRAELEARLLPGRFVLWCSLPDHRRRGMSGTFLVRRS